MSTTTDSLDGLFSTTSSSVTSSGNDGYTEVYSKPKSAEVKEKEEKRSYSNDYIQDYGVILYDDSARNVIYRYKGRYFIIYSSDRMIEITKEDYEIIRDGQTNRFLESPQTIRYKKEKRQQGDHSGKYSIKDVEIKPDQMMILFIEKRRVSRRIVDGRRVITYNFEIHPQIIVSNVNQNVSSYLNPHLSTSTDGIMEATTDTLVFDKNFNYLTIGRPSDKKLVDKTYKTLPDFYQVSDRRPQRSNVKEGSTVGYIIIDKHKLIQNNSFVIKEKHGNISSLNVINAYKDLKNGLKRMRTTINTIREMTNEIYKDNEFEILYSFDLYNYSLNSNMKITLTILHKNVIIENSVGYTKYLGDMITRFSMFDLNVKESVSTFSISRQLDGHRLTFYPHDIPANFAHSHLSGMRSFGGYCLGEAEWFDKSSSSGDEHQPINKDVFQSILIGVMGFISWESLEGGPFKTMESIKRPLKYENIQYSLIQNEKVKEETKEFLKYLYSDKSIIVNIIKRFSFRYSRKRKSYYYIYNPKDVLDYINRTLPFKEDSDIFYQSGGGYVTKGKGVKYTPAQIKKARETINSKINFVYLDGKYLRPSVILLKDDDVTDGLKKVFNPNAVLEAINIIVYHLNKKINEYVESEQG